MFYIDLIFIFHRILPINKYKISYFFLLIYNSQSHHVPNLINIRRRRELRCPDASKEKQWPIFRIKVIYRVPILFRVSIIRPNSSPKCFVIFILAIARETGEISSYF
jgi:hypothetical protein